ncbi:MgtC/SapB family protein [Fusobacterium sp.]|uniref:MgtC/SapB family protein n=1 Tax=Fusobacterium sp. TaxID=68766 RepID=UPI00396C4D8D
MNSFCDVLTLKEISIRILMSIFIGGIIGYERGHQNRPAGFRTHILVCLGAAIVSMVQDQLRINIQNYVMVYPEVAQVVKTDLGRIGAQVVSGIGFLGAGTIMRDKGVIGGLTTAASIWTTGCVGLGIGWGFYNIAIPAVIAVIIVLVILKKLEVVLIENKHIVKIEVQFKPDVNYGQALIKNYSALKEMNVQLKKLDKNFAEKKAIYTLVVTKQMNQFDIVAELSVCDYIAQVIV